MNQTQQTPVPQHDPESCDKHRPRGWACNQPHAASDPFGMRRPLPALPWSPSSDVPEWVRRARERSLPTKVLA